MRISDWASDVCSADLGPGDCRSHSPLCQPGNVERKLGLGEALRAIAQARGATVAQIVIAWVLAQGPDIVPLIGARRRDRLQEALGALALDLGPDDLAAIEEAAPRGAAAGERYAPAQMAMLDSERRAG